MNRLLSVALLCVAALPQLAQQGKRPANAGGALVTVTAKPDRYELQPGKSLEVTLTLKAGARGAYLPNYFAAWSDTCQAGFAVEVFTLDNVRASTATRGCAGSILGPGPPPEELLKDYLLLRPGEKRSWRTTLSDLPTKPGIYMIEAEYLSGRTRIQEVAALPAVHGLMVIGHVPAQPVHIRIR